MRLILNRSRNTKLELSLPAGPHEVAVEDDSPIVAQLVAAGFLPVDDPKPARKPAVKKAAASDDDAG